MIAYDAQAPNFLREVIFEGLIGYKIMCGKQERNVFTANSPEKKSSHYSCDLFTFATRPKNHKTKIFPQFFLHKECDKLMLLSRNEAVEGLISLRMCE